MYTHFNQFDPSITDAQDAELQTKFPGKLGNLSLGQLLLDERGKEGNSIPPPPERLQRYMMTQTFEKGDILSPAIPLEISWEKALTEIIEHSLMHPHLTLAFEGDTRHYRIDHLGPIEVNARILEPSEIQTEDFLKLRFFQGKIYIGDEK